MEHSAEPVAEIAGNLLAAALMRGGSIRDYFNTEKAIALTVNEEKLQWYVDVAKKIVELSGAK
jgi:hypothetical protein